MYTTSSISSSLVDDWNRSGTRLQWDSVIVASVSLLPLLLSLYPGVSFHHAGFVNNVGGIFDRSACSFRDSNPVGLDVFLALDTASFSRLAILDPLNS